MIHSILLIAIGATLLSVIPAAADCSAGAGDDDFCGSHREPAKTSFVRSSSGRLARFERYKGVADLTRLLAADDRMRKKYRPFPDQRVREERHNVVVRGYVVAVKPCEDDRDYHVILKDEHASVFMNVEVSGLPRSGRGTQPFKTARAQIVNLLADAPAACGSYSKLGPPIHVEVKGSVFFDDGHGAGCLHCPGTKGAKPKTVWEIHPVYSIKPL